MGMGFFQLGMNVPGRHEKSPWQPTSPQECLLKTVFSERAEALKSWHAWKQGVVLDEIDGGSQRLLPLVHERLKGLAPDDEQMERLKGVYKKTWFINQIFMTNAARVVRKLQKAGIPVLLFKGLALILKYYQNPALRPMTDVDLAVPWAQAETAGNLLQKLGYRFKIPASYPIFRENVMALKNGVNFVNESGYHLDLHWGLLKHAAFPEANRGFWERAKPVMFRGARALALTPEDQLLQVLEHGAHWGRIPTVRWVADALYILRGCREFDWGYFSNVAIEKQLAIPVFKMTTYLKNTFDFPVPDGLMKQLKNHRASGFEIRLYHSMTEPKNMFIIRSIRFYRQLFLRYQFYLRQYKKVGCDHNFLSFLRFFRFRWDLKSVWMVPLVFPHKLLKKILGYLNRKFISPGVP